jgi:hypothetical protein
MKFKTLLIIFILLVVSLTSVSFGQDKPKVVKDLTAPAAGSKADQIKDLKNTFQREAHRCDSAKINNQSGVLKYDLDCAAFNQDQVLDLTGKSSYSIVGWIPRIITIVYRFMFTIAVIAFLIASFKYYKAAVTGKGGFGVGFQEAKVALTSSLVGFLIASSAWVGISIRLLRSNHSMTEFFRVDQSFITYS